MTLRIEPSNFEESPLGSAEFASESRGVAKDSVASLLPNALQDLSEKGWHLLDKPLSQEAFYELGRALGDVWRETDVKVIPGSKWFASSGRQLGLHNDNPYANIVLWRCEEECDLGIPTKVIDLRDVLMKLPERDRELLGEVNVPIPNWKESSFEPEPLLAVGADGRIRANYVDWFDADAPSPEHQAAVERFEQAVADVAQESVLDFVLEKGQVLLIDNNRMLHGRSEVPDATKRFLLRLWVNTDGTEDLPRNL